MADPKIRVGADMSAVASELGKLEAAAEKVVNALTSGEVGIDVKKAKADLAALKDHAEAVANSLAKMGDAGAPSDVDFNKIAKALERAANAGEDLEKVLEAVGQSTNMDKSIRASKAVADNLDRARRAHEILTREGIKLSTEQSKALKEKFDHYRNSGARGTSKLRGMEFDDWVGGGWRNHSIHEGDARRNRNQILKSLGVQPEGSGIMADMRSRLGNRGMGAAGGAIGGVLSGSDGFFGAVGSAGGSLVGMGAGALVGGPVGAVVGGLVGGVASKVLGAFGGMLDQALQRVMNDAVNLTDLKHSIGGATTNFMELRENIRVLSSDLRLTHEEASRLARTFSDAAGTTMSGAEVGRGMQLGGGFSRSFGLDPAMGTAFFGTMRRMGADSDNRLALKIGEVVARNGVGPQMAAVIQAIQNYTETSTRLSFTKANASGYADFMSSMFGGSMAGSKDVGAITSAMGAADAAMRQGGAFGEASKAFSLGLFQRKLPGFSVFDLDVMKEQGAFGTIGQAFGKDSAAYKFAMARGDRRTAGKYARWAGMGGDETVLSMQMKGLEQFYGGNTDEFRKSIMGHFGVGAGQATALYDAYKRPGGLGTLQKQLAAAGVNLDQINPKQIGDLAQVSGMDRAGLRAHIKTMLKDENLSDGDKSALQKALLSENVEEARKTVLKVTALNETMLDQGEILDQQRKTMERLLDETVTRLVPTVIDIKNAIISLVSAIAPNAGSPGLMGYDAVGKGDLTLKNPRAIKNREAVVNRLRGLGASREETNGILGLIHSESGFDNKAHVTTKLGLHTGLGQLSPAYRKNLGIRDPWSANEQVDKVPKEMLRILRKYQGGNRYHSPLDLLAAEWLGGSGKVTKDKDGQWRIKEAKDKFGTSTTGYGEKVGAIAKGYDTHDLGLGTNDVAPNAVPTDSPADLGEKVRQSGYSPIFLNGGGRQQVDVNANVILQDGRGNPVPNAVVKTQVGAPKPAGAGGW